MRDYVTMREIAEQVGVRPVTVRQWRSRHGDFPQPVRAYGDTLVFKPHEVDLWLKRHHKVAA